MTEPPPPPAPPLTTVFVYGTLMPGERNAHIAALGGTFRVQRATLPGHHLLHLWPEAYPAALPGDLVAHTPGLQAPGIHGFALTYAPDDWPAALSLLDELEGTGDTPPLYTRERVTLTLDGGQPQTAWVYLYAQADRLTRPGVLPVMGGDWTTVPDRSRTAQSDR